MEVELRSMYERAQGGILVEQLKESYVTIEEDIQALIDAKKALLIEPPAKRGQAKPAPGQISDKAMLFYREVKYEVGIDKAFKEKWVGCKLDGKAATEIKKMLAAAKLPLMRTEVVDDGVSGRDFFHLSATLLMDS